jgi:hypothetical protein
MSAKVAEPKPLTLPQIRAAIANAEGLRDIARGDKLALLPRLKMARARAAVDGDTSALLSAEAALAAATRNETEADSKLCTLQPLLVVAAHQDMLIERAAKLHLNAERAAEYKKKKARFDELEREYLELEPQVRSLASYVSWAGTSTIDAQIARFEQEHRAELEAAGVLGHG